MIMTPILRQTAQVLEWQELIEFLAKEAASSIGAEHCRVLVFASDLQTARCQQQETTEMVQMMLEGAPPLPSLVFPDVRNVLTRAEKGGMLDGTDLRDISLIVGLSQTIRHLLQKQGAGFPAIGARSQDLHEMIWVKQAIDTCIDENGHLRDSASPELHKFTQKSQQLRQIMRRRLEHMLASQPYKDLLQGQYFAERENRYVIPVKVERQHDIDGIVHDISSSGATVFVEPRELIELNNSIKFADLQVAQEVRHILQDLSGLMSEHVSSIQESLNALAALDCLMAKARLSIKMQASPIQLNQEHRIRLHQARHPLLVLTKEHVVPNAIRLEGDTRALIISGPNAGGKTVSLKMVGLIAMMIKAGLHPPSGPDSEMAFFDQVYADIGDAQNLRNDVSSFSGHILNMIAIIQNIQAFQETSRVHSLVLLDEVGSSTDPLEGAALAEALLIHLCGMECSLVATTHYPSLKTLALRNLHFRNASQEFDLPTLSPTYRLLDGIPGGSSALEIAKRLGLDSSIIQAAQSLITPQDRDLDRTFRSLHNTRLQLEIEVSHAQRLREEAQRLQDEAQSTRNLLQRQEQEDRQRYRKQWQQEFSKAQRQLNQLVDDAKKDQDLSQLQTIQQRARTINQEVLSHLPNPTLQTPISPQEGDLVEIEPLGTRGILLENPQGKKHVSIRVGAQTIRTAPSAVRLATPSFPALRPQGGNRRDSDLPPSSGDRMVAGPPGASSGTDLFPRELDIRGVRLEDAMEMTVAALDQLLVNQAKYLKVIHGHGAGTLKSAIRKFCRTSPYIQQYRSGDPAEGGDGVTVIELR